MDYTIFRGDFKKPSNFTACPNGCFCMRIYDNTSRRGKFNVKAKFKIWLTYRRLKVNLLAHNNASRTENVDVAVDMIPIQLIMLVPHTNAHTLLQLSYMIDCD